MKNVIVAILCVICFACKSNAQGTSSTPKDEKIAILEKLLNGKWDEKIKAIEWTPTPGDVIEFNANLGEKKLYTFVDTVFKNKDENRETYYVIFHTAPMIYEEGNFRNSNSCHVCTVNLGYLILYKDSDSFVVDNYKRNFAAHGTFGEKTYTLSFVKLGNGDNLIKVDDPYEGMGEASVATYFYNNGETILSMISKSDNSGAREKNEKGYLEYKSAFSYDKNGNIVIKQTGYSIDENTGKKVLINKTKTLLNGGFTLQF